MCATKPQVNPLAPAFRTLFFIKAEPACVRVCVRSCSLYT